MFQFYQVRFKPQGWQEGEVWKGFQFYQVRFKPWLRGKSSRLFYVSILSSTI